MNQKSILVLAAATAAAVAAVYLTTNDGGGSEVSGAESGRLFPDLQGRVNDAARVVVRQGEDTVDVALQDGDWVLADRGGYPAEFEEAKETILQVADLEIDEVKTSNPAYFEQLGLQEPGPDAGQTKEVEIYDAGGELLAAVLLGKSARGSSDGTFVRRSGEDQAYQVSGRVEASTRLADWTTTDLLKLPADRVQEVELTHPDGETLRVYRDPLDPAGTPVVADVPEGRELTYATVANPILQALASLQFDDVRPAGEVEVPEDATTHARFRRDDGLRVELHLTQVDETWWARLDASHDPSDLTRPTPPEPPEPSDADDAPTEEPEAGAGEEADAAGSGENEAEGGATDPAAAAQADYEAELAAYEAAVAEGAAEAERLNDAHGPWVYALPAFRATNLTKRMGDLLKPPADPAGDAVGPEGAAPADDASGLDPGELEQLLKEAGIDPQQLQAGGDPPATPTPADGADPDGADPDGGDGGDAGADPGAGGAADGSADPEAGSGADANGGADPGAHGGADPGTGGGADGGR